MKGYFITGTDTDIGKTITTSLLTLYFQQRKVRVFPYKPIQSGAIEHDGKLYAPDVQIYQQVQPSLNSKQAYTYLLKKPSSPHLAAKEEQITIDTYNILRNIKNLEKNNDLLLIEGAGGVMVPINENGYCMLDLIKEVAFPTIVVARAGLGTINHTVLTIMALKQARVSIEGIILNRLEKGDPLIEKDNKKMLETLTGIPVIGTIPFIENINLLLTHSKQQNHLFKQLDHHFLKEENKIELKNTL